MKSNKLLIIITGAIIGAIAVLLVKFGNPANMGFCIACFIRDTAGALKLHSAAIVQYMRPEIIGLVLGASIMAFSKKEMIARSGSNPLIRFVLGFFVMVGALMFLGCPLRMMLRIGGGDFNAIEGGPYYLMAYKPAVHYTMGGLHINTDAQVLDDADAPIPGLYAAGEVAGHKMGTNRLGSCSMSDIYTFGRIAGKNAAAFSA